MVRERVKQGEVLIWCRKCSGYARQKKGPKFMYCCKQEQVGTKEHGHMLKRIQTLEDGRTPAKEGSKWKIQRQKRITREEYRDCAGTSLQDKGSLPTNNCKRVQGHA